MAGKKVGNIVAKTGSFTDRGGNEKNRWQKIGVMFEGDDGSHYGIIEAVPVGTEWTGGFSVFPDDDKGKKEKPAEGDSGGREDVGGDFNDRVPFIDPYKFNANCY